MTNENEHASRWGSKGDFPQETADQWGDIRAGGCLLVDERGYPVDDIEDAAYLLHPSSVGGSGGLPPVGSTPIGEPENPAPYDTWFDPDTKRLKVWDGESTE